MALHRLYQALKGLFRIPRWDLLSGFDAMQLYELLFQHEFSRGVLFLGLGFRVLGGSWDLVSTLIGVISSYKYTCLIYIAPATRSHDPLNPKP